ncbi:hypothetical protein [Furfurilactobacillus siliginis]|uniref:Uncharacterized protein n=1 Tax=Furfurilactobacillus siliginis TaxID=348151 RepID=A0A0R2KXV6_9LACO|nr:hypothetical protein [Furfurilactobacillus siliginis]KRN94112.1 hypothetical protein IV55_GL000625 [Furfurilactobacillus siliginis]GEK29084.1 hypothetical protein LSI01_13950 [Furfurilactobacillus siliginis]
MIFFVNEAMGIGNSGVEHAEFYRAKLFRRSQRPFKFLFTGLIEEQHEAMDKWHLAEDEIVNMWEYFVFGDRYGRFGSDHRVTKTSRTIVDGTQTTRMISTVTVSGMRIVKYMVKFPNPDKEGMLLVSTNRIELFDDATGEQKASYELLTMHKRVQLRNIHLFHQGTKDAHLFFANAVQLHAHFFKAMDRLFNGHSTFIIDRG